MQNLDGARFASAEVWEKMWNDDTLPFWQKEDVHQVLVEHHSEFTAGRKNLRIFLPLCGKSVDMLWLADEGHTVVGVEMIEKAVKEFFTENKLEYIVKVEKSSPQKPALRVYASKEKDITIFVCDIFQFINSRPERLFDCIWDRGSLVAIYLTKDERIPRYVQGMLSLLAQDGRYFTETSRHNLGELKNSKVIIIPNVTEEDMIELFRDRCNFRLVGMKTYDKDPMAKGRPTVAHSMIYHIMTFK